jgi:hypothetical protein
VEILNLGTANCELILVLLIGVSSTTWQVLGTPIRRVEKVCTLPLLDSSSPNTLVLCFITALVDDFGGSHSVCLSAIDKGVVEHTQHTWHTQQTQQNTTSMVWIIKIDTCLFLQHYTNHRLKNILIKGNFIAPFVVPCPFCCLLSCRDNVRKRQCQKTRVFRLKVASLSSNENDSFEKTARINFSNIQSKQRPVSKETRK